MPITPVRVRGTPEWDALALHFEKLRDVHLRQLFAEDPLRGEAMTAEAADLVLDYSKNRLTPETVRLLAAVAERAGLAERIEAMFSGEHINVTEDRAVLHTALRAPEGSEVDDVGQNVVPEVQKVLAKMADFAEAVRAGQWRGFTGKRIKNIVNIGIGGSDLGPAMAYEALLPFSDRALTLRFVSNVDGADIWEATADIDAAETLFVVSSKTFTTLETIGNAKSAREWLLASLGDARAVGRHFVAVLDERGRGGPVRDRPGQHVRVLGLGGRTLLVRLRHRPFADDLDWAAAVPGNAGRVQVY